jgi:putative acetyltransferase
MPDTLSIRVERPDDIPVIRAVNERAFGQREEADVIDRIRRNHREILSLVALNENRVVGHILFSPAVIGQGSGVVQGMGLGPMAVLPEQQRHGIGSALVRQGLGILRERRCPFVIVLGHPSYYPRFGFERASRYGIHCEWEVSDDAFMILILDRSRMKAISGLARYLPEFGAAQ